MKLTLNLGKRSYDIIIKRGSLQNVGKLANLNRKVLVVTDNGVPEKYSDTVLKQCKTGFKCTVPQGENSKSMQTYTQLLQQMADNNFTRKDAVLAVGGGMVGDLAGFAASTYMRGIDFINCPTTTLAQIDSSIGGKVAINLGSTKNIVGAFHQPKAVGIDPDTLSTLSQRQFAQGLAEAIKAGLIMDESLFNMFENDDVANNIEQIIFKSLVIKKDVVQKDETEQGLRAVLNFGHTIGHGIESLQLGELYHGECVALGMLAMITDDELRQRTIKVLKKLNLPHTIKYNQNEVYKHVCHDKKAQNNFIKTVKVKQPGSFYFENVEYDDMRKLIGEGI